MKIMPRTRKNFFSRALGKTPTCGSKKQSSNGYRYSTGSNLMYGAVRKKKNLKNRKTIAIFAEKDVSLWRNYKY